MLRTGLYMGLAFLLLAGAASAQDALKDVRCFIAGKQQVQFAGFIVAQEKGIYAKYGLRVTFVPGERGRAAALLASGKTDFTVLSLASALQLRAKKNPIVHLAQILHSSSLMVVAKKSSGIRTIQDLNGRKTGVFGGEQQVLSDAFLKQNQIRVRPVTQGTSINLFLLNGIDACFVRSFDEYHTIINSGVDSAELLSFPFADGGLAFPEDGIYCTEKTYAGKKELCEKFVRASLEGWTYAIQKPAESTRCLIEFIRRSNNPVNAAHIKWVLEKITPLIIRGDTNSIRGELRETDYQSAAERLLKLGLLPGIPDFHSFHRAVSY